jgi:MFS transporter, PPP family, 3-phenylpropionic acid transporter
MTSAPLPEPGGASPSARVLHTQLSGFYFVYYVAVGAFVPYWPLYLHSLGYSPAQIGAALATTGQVRVIVPVGWGWLMDRSGRRMPWIAAGMALSALFFAAVPFASSFGVLIALHAIYAIFWNVALPAFDVVTLNHLARTGADYARIRLWGSIGFILAVAALGPILDRAGVGPVPWVVVAAMLGMMWLGLRVPDVHDPRPHDAALGGFMARVRRPAVLALLATCFLSQLSFAPFYGFFSLHLEQHDYSRGVIGALWALGVVAEVIVFLYTGRIIRRWGARPVLIVSLLSTAFRWLLLAQFVDVAALLVLSQVLHFLSFAVYHAVTVHYVHELFPGRLQGRGQALLAAVSFGLGGALGSLLTGAAWESWGARAVYLAATGAALLGAWTAARAPRLDRRAQPVMHESASLEA